MLGKIEVASAAAVVQDEDPYDSQARSGHGAGADLMGEDGGGGEGPHAARVWAGVAFPDGFMILR